jgi:hypothetical protein
MRIVFAISLILVGCKNSSEKITDQEDKKANDREDSSCELPGGCSNEQDSVNLKAGETQKISREANKRNISTPGMHSNGPKVGTGSSSTAGGSSSGVGSTSLAGNHSSSNTSGETSVVANPSKPTLVNSQAALTTKPIKPNSNSSPNTIPTSICHLFIHLAGHLLVLRWNLT